MPHLLTLNQRRCCRCSPLLWPKPPFPCPHWDPGLPYPCPPLQLADWPGPLQLAIWAPLWTWRRDSPSHAAYHHLPTDCIPAKAAALHLWLSPKMLYPSHCQWRGSFEGYWEGRWRVRRIHTCILEVKDLMKFFWDITSPSMLCPPKESDSLFWCWQYETSPSQWVTQKSAIRISSMQS